MSVFAGILHFDDTPIDRESMTKFSDCVEVHGPDGKSIYYEANFGVMYRPLHTTRESRNESQPYRSLSGHLVLWDGRLDNREDLVSRLECQLRSDHTDVAIASAAFDRWGADSFANLIGDWAIAIWDPHQRELVLARDYIGVKHLFYSHIGHRIAWCTHLKPLVLCGNNLTLCDEYIAGYLAFYPDAHLTPYSEIQAVPPGKYVCVHEHHTRTYSYWQLHPDRIIRYRNDAEYGEHYYELFRQAVRRRLRADTPVLAELSGGFDSSSVVCMADDLTEREVPEARIDTFSFYDSNEPEEDDLLYFTIVESKRKKKGFRFDLKGSGDSFLADDKSFAATPGPGSRAEVRSALSGIIHRFGYRVILSGFGGDQINGQTLDPRVQMADLLLQFRLIKFAKELTNWSLLIRKRPWIQLLTQTLMQFVPVQVRAHFKDATTDLPWVDRGFARKYRISARMLEMLDGVLFVRPGARDAMQTIATLSRNLSSCRPSILEKRYPYLDQHLVEFLARIPSEQLLRPGQRRWLMRRALGNLLPAEILNRKTKARVGRYPCAVMQKHWQEVDQVLSSSIAGDLGYISSYDLRKALLAMKNGRLPLYVLRLVNAISLEFWLRDLQARGIVQLPRSKDLRSDPERSSCDKRQDWISASAR